MRKVVFLLVFTLTVIGLLSACSNDSDKDNDFPGTIIEEVKCNPTITAFFDEKVYSGGNYSIMGGDYTPFLNEKTGEIRDIIVINSEEELLELFPDAINLPEIDFSKNSLVIGRMHFVNTLGEKRPIEQKRKVMYKNGNDYTLSLYYSYSIIEIASDMVEYVATWGIYPKLSSNSLNIILKFV